MDQHSRAPATLPRRSGYVLPEGATDTHFHVFGPADRFPYASVRDFTPADALPSTAGTLFSELGIERAVLVQASVYGMDNARHLSALAELGMPAKVVVAADPGASAGEIADLARQGAIAVRMIVVKQGWPDLDVLRRFSRLLADNGMHLQFLARPDQLAELAAFVETLACPVVIDHLGLINPEGGLQQPALQALRGLLATGRCFAKISGCYRVSKQAWPYSDLDEIIGALVGAAPDRLIWGSDWPHPAFSGPVPSLSELVEALFRWVPDEAVRHRILVDNPATLFGFPIQSATTSKKREQ